MTTAIGLMFTAATPALAASTLLALDPSGPGRVFEGIGAASASGDSRLLIDYPEKQRAEVLDYLFKPRFGASLQILKSEIGGDVNSTSGVEPSFQHDRGDIDISVGY